MLDEIVDSVQVQYRQKGTVLFEAGAIPQPWVFFIRQGAVHLYAEEPGGPRLVDICDVGDLFGMRPLLAGESYLLTAIVEEESLIYAMEAAVFSRQLEWIPL